MKIITLSILILFASNIFGQDTIKESSPFEEAYRKSNPTLKYYYDNLTQTHNYADNWDFDNDGIKDKLLFVGTGGAHVYYFLQVTLSSEKQYRAFNFIETDFPYLTSTDTLNINQAPYGFVVATLGSSLFPSIIIRLDESSFASNKNLFRKMGIHTKTVVMSFEKGIVKYGCL